jgi:cyclophilin family peptidyl-prolyl cis-trans isomerase
MSPKTVAKRGDPMSKTSVSALFTFCGPDYNGAGSGEGESRMSRRVILALAGLLVALVPVSAFAQSAQTPAELCAAALPAAEPATREFSAPEQVLQSGVDYRAILCTSAGPVYVDLFESVAPETVNNFVFLAENGYYNNTTFHRVIEGFMAQGGDPTATGSGGPGYQFKDEFAGFLNFDRPGLLAMANAGANTNGSQFFITTAPTPHLDYQHTIFGEVLDGQASVDAIELRDPATATTPGTTLDTVLIVTDPSMVAADVPALETATTADLQAALDNAHAQVSDPLAVDADLSGVLDLAATVAQFPEAVQADAQTMLDANGFDARVRSSISNAGCAFDQAGWGNLGFTLDVYADAASAAAAIASGVYDAALTAEGLAPGSVEGWTQPIYTAPASVCDQDMTEAATVYQRGRNVLEVRVVVPETEQATPAMWITDFAGLLYERFFADVLRASLR